MKKSTFCILSFLFFTTIFLVGCDLSANSYAYFTSESAIFWVGDTESLQDIGYTTNAKETDLQFYVKDSNIAKVEDGNVVFLASGKTELVLKLGDNLSILELTVKPKVVIPNLRPENKQEENSSDTEQDVTPNEDIAQQNLNDSSIANDDNSTNNSDDIVTKNNDGIEGTSKDKISTNTDKTDENNSNENNEQSSTNKDNGSSNNNSNEDNNNEENNEQVSTNEDDDCSTKVVNKDSKTPNTTDENSLNDDDNTVNSDTNDENVSQNEEKFSDDSDSSTNDNNSTQTDNTDSSTTEKDNPTNKTDKNSLNDVTQTESDDIQTENDENYVYSTSTYYLEIATNDCQHEIKSFSSKTSNNLTVFFLEIRDNNGEYNNYNYEIVLPTEHSKGPASAEMSGHILTVRCGIKCDFALVITSSDNQYLGHAIITFRYKD